ncbi:MAG: tripartite tricarboxylate transporter permease [Thermodesulfobacteriota bacterium]|nr:tripartite tricarboxylate transporter permease [Thermodesulfobacteriota bacterium]
MLFEACHSLLQGFSVALSLKNLWYCFIGVTVGNIVGVLPGFGPVSAVAILIPLMYGVEPVSAIILLAGIYYGAMYGGSITSILLKIPGESSSVMTAIDGYELALKGRAGPALGISAIASFVAGTLSVIFLTFFAPLLASFALSFGAPEYFSLMVMGFAAVAVLSTGDALKGGISAVLGIILATVGSDVITGIPRFHFGSIYLLDGIDFLVVAIGVFAIAEVLDNVVTKSKFGQRLSYGKWTNLLPSLNDLKVSFWPTIRATFIGFTTGVLPGAGATIASFISYATEKRVSKYPEKFGTGVMEAVAGPEAANNAATGGAMVPLLTLGIPGSNVTAVMLGALMMLGLQPGPLLFKEHPTFVWGFIASMYVGNVMLLILNIPLIGVFVQVLRLSFPIIAILVLEISLVGVYAFNNNIFDLYIMFVFGIIGFLLKKLDFPLAPMILALVLGRIFEEHCRRSLIISDGSFTIFLTRPISLTLLVVAVLVMFYPMILDFIRQHRKGKDK